MKFPTKNQMRTVGVYNPFELCSLLSIRKRVYISFSAGQVGRGGQSAQYCVKGIGFKVHPKSPWYDSGGKSFIVWEDKQETLAKATAWTDKKFGKREWVRDPWGSYQDARVLPLIHAKIKEATRNTP